MKPVNYKILLLNYLAQTVSVEQFETEFLNSFMNEPEHMDKQLFDILEDLFEDIDAYSPMWTSQDEKDFPYRITESTLREEVALAIQKLEQYIANPSKNAT